MKRDVNNIPVFIKELFILTPFQHIMGTVFLNILNRLKVEGRDILKQLPENNVLFVSNHQTYFMEGIAMMAEFNHTRHPLLHWCWKAGTGKCYYIVAMETAYKKGWIHRIIEWGGAVTVTRTWRKDRQNLKPSEISVEHVRSDQEKVIRAVNDGWVITFPQGTTTPFSKGRKGTSYIIKESKCVVVPVVIDGFSKAFHRTKPCWPLKTGTCLTLRFKPPLNIDYTASAEDILNQIMDAIEQSDKFQQLPADSSIKRDI